MGSFITAYARNITITAAQDNYDMFAYADTDSLHLLTDSDPDSLNIHPQELGAWKHEYAFTEALFVRAKTYIELKQDGEHETHIAGLSVKVANELTLDNFTSGETYKGNLKQKIVPGGIVLQDSGFTAPVW